jgi:hypothetical protein
LLVYADRVRRMAAAELAQEVTRLTDIPEAQRQPAEEMQLAIALAQTRVPADLVRAQGLAQRVLGNPREEARGLYPLAGMLVDIENSPNAAALKDNFGASYKHMKGNEPARVQLKAAYDKRLAALTTVPPKTLQQYAEDIDNAADITIAQNTLDEAKTKLTADEVDTLQKNFDMAWKA